ncbi:MAG: hypothetical protein Q7K45_07705 [Nanoarchaeota archaeon]|nr:hypothetical protein [Nanoarchaeota archaeon]
MTEPKIVYGTLEQSLHSNAQYLLMQAGIGNGTYTPRDFIEAIERVSLDTIAKPECKRDLVVQRNFLRTMAGGKERIVLRDFQPDRERLEAFVNTTFDDILGNLYLNQRECF